MIDRSNSITPPPPSRLRARAKRGARHVAVAALAGAAMTTSAPAAGPAGPPEMHTYVTVEGVRYHVVSYKTEWAHVMGDPAPVKPSPEMREHMLRAVVEATGCRLVEDSWVDAELRGKLDCTDRRPRKDW